MAPALLAGVASHCTRTVRLCDIAARIARAAAARAQIKPGVSLPGDMRRVTVQSIVVSQRRAGGRAAPGAGSGRDAGRRRIAVPIGRNRIAADAHPLTRAASSRIAARAAVRAGAAAPASIAMTLGHIGAQILDGTAF